MAVGFTVSTAEIRSLQFTLRPSSDFRHFLPTTAPCAQHWAGLSSPAECQLENEEIFVQILRLPIHSHPTSKNNPRKQMIPETIHSAQNKEWSWSSVQHKVRK